MMLAHIQQNMTKHISIPGVEILKAFIYSIRRQGSAFVVLQCLFGHGNLSFRKTLSLYSLSFLCTESDTDSVQSEEDSKEVCAKLVFP